MCFGGFGRGDMCRATVGSAVVYLYREREREVLLNVCVFVCVCDGIRQ